MLLYSRTINRDPRDAAQFEKPELLRRYESICAGRPRALKEFDQWYMEPRQAFFRLAYMHSRGDLVDRDVFVIGDDDLVGLAAALTGLPRRVLVLEIDERLVEFTNRMAREHGLQERLEARMFDVRQEFPAELRGRFDVFVCDPAETLTGLRLFLSRGAAGLRGEGSAAYFGLTSLEASKAKWLKVQRLCHQMGFLVTDIRRAFTEYPNPGWDPSLAFWAKLEQAPAAPWYRSAFWRLEAVNPPVSALDGPFTGPVEDLYIDDEVRLVAASACLRRNSVC
jgi:predicted methyltransferase